MNIFLMQDEFVGEEQWEYALASLERNLSVDIEHDVMNTQQNMETQKLISQHYFLEETTQPNTNTLQGLTTERKKKVDYQKNICAYVTKKVVHCLLSAPYRRTVEKLCKENSCQYGQVKEYYGEMIRQCFGITLLAVLITPQHQQEIQIKKVFRAFLKWFLRNKYMYYLLKFGKMQDKDKYIQFKNKYLLYIEQQTTKLQGSDSNLN